jgi:hypothetical protein
MGRIGDNPRRIEVIPETPPVRRAPAPTPPPKPAPREPQRKTPSPQKATT